MKFLLTGMTSVQTNPVSHSRNLNYFGLLRHQLRCDEHEVWWQDPSILMEKGELMGFDKVIVGLSPILSLGANRAYGALSIIQRLWDTKKLVLAIDAPDPFKIPISLKAALESSETDGLFKEFFSYRKEYDLAVHREHHNRLLLSVHRLLTETWPTTILPTTPWMDRDVVLSQLPEVARNSVQFVSVDHLILGLGTLDEMKREDFWSYDGPGSSPWLGRQNISYGVKPLPNSFRTKNNDAVLTQLRRSQGCLIAPRARGGWWSPKISMSLLQETPIYTDWHSTREMGDAWAFLPGTYEYLSREKKRIVGLAQLEDYQAAIPTRREVSDQLGSSVYNRCRTKTA